MIKKLTSLRNTNARSALSSLRKVFITESARNNFIFTSPCHALNSLLFAPDGYPTATEDPTEIEETARTGTAGGDDTRGAREPKGVPKCLKVRHRRQHKVQYAVAIRTL